MLLPRAAKGGIQNALMIIIGGAERLRDCSGFLCISGSRGAGATLSKRLNGHALVACGFS